MCHSDYFIKYLFNQSPMRKISWIGNEANKSVLTMLAIISSAVAGSLLQSGGTVVFGQQPEAGAANIVSLAPPAADRSVVRGNEQFSVSWQAVNQGTADSAPFTDALVIRHFPEGSADCPPSSEGQVVYDSQTNAANPADFDEPVVPAGSQGPVMQTSVGPFPAGWVRLEVTLGVGQYDYPTSSCMQIQTALSSESTSLQQDGSSSAAPVEMEEPGFSSPGDSFESAPQESEFGDGGSFDSTNP
jgi:hypothetical protein